MYTVSPVLAPVLYLPGLLYEMIVRVRIRLYAGGHISPYRLPAPVISIGNITMGGSGKTPLVIRVAQTLLDLGYTPAVLTRGYGRVHPRYMHIIAPGEILPNAASTIGDEPALIQRRVPSAWLGVSPKRHEAGKSIAAKNPKVAFILDDGFQHRRLHRDLDIVVIDASQPLQSNRVFPRGTLREPLSELRRCDLLVLHGLRNTAESCSIETEIRNLKPNAIVLRCEQKIVALLPFPVWQRPAAGDRMAGVLPVLPKSPYLVGAIGNPERFQQDIRRMGMSGPGATFFPDHHPISRKDWQRCADRARRKGADTIITTEKDAVKIDKPPDFPLMVAIQTTEMEDDGRFRSMIGDCIKEAL